MRHVQIPCGLNIYLYTHPSCVSQFQLYTRFGSDTLECRAENQIIKLEPGSAHYFEHILFIMPPEGKRYRRLHPKKEKDIRDGMTILENNKSIDTNAYTWNDITNYYFASRVNKEKNLETLLEFVFSTYIPQDRFEKEKGTILDEARRSLDDPSDAMADLWNAQAYHIHNARFPVLGTLESIQNINLKALDTTHDVFYRPSNMGLIITGNEDIEKIAECAQKKLETMGKGAYCPPPEEIKVAEPKKVRVRDNFLAPISRSDIEHSEMMTGWKVLHKQSIDEYMKMAFVSTMLSDPGTKARETMIERGIEEYNFHGDCMKFRTHGQILLSCNTDDPEKTLGIIDHVVDDVRKNGFAREEIEYARNNFLLNARTSLESVSSIGSSLTRWAVLTGDARQYFQMRERLKTITADEINASVNDLLNPEHRTSVLMVPNK